MLKLKYLFDNQNLAIMIVKNWLNTDEVPPLFKYYQISSNAIYPFRMNDEVVFLRFAPVKKGSKENILAELEYLKYLKKKNCSVVETVLSIKGNELEVLHTPWGTYNAVVFKRVLGEQLGEVKLTDDIIFNWGKKLGTMHQLSKKYKSPQYKRLSWKDQFNWMREVLIEFPNQHTARKEVDLLEEFFEGLPQNDDNFGLIHFDIEPDNVFYHQESGVFTPIDFDDSLYHWYVMDVERSLNSISDEFPENEKKFSYQFIEGYRSIMTIDDVLFSYIPLFTRYGNLYGYIRILLSQNEKWENEPDWMIKLRQHLDKLMEKRSSQFGEPIKLKE